MGMAQVPINGPDGETYLSLGTLLDILYSPTQDTVVTGGNFGLYFWNALTGELIRKENTFDRAFNSENAFYDFTMSKDGQTVYALKADGIYKTFKKSTNSGYSFRGGDYGTYFYGISADEKIIVTQTQKGVKVWETENFSEAVHLSESIVNAGRVILSNQALYLLARQDQDQPTTDLKLFSLKTGKLIKQLPVEWDNENKRTVESVFSKDDQYILTYGKDVKTQLWLSESGSPIFTSTEKISSALFLKNNDFLTLQNGKINVYRYPDYSLIKTISKDGLNFYSMSEGDSENQIFFYAQRMQDQKVVEKQLVFWDGEKEEEIRSFPLPQSIPVGFKLIPQHNMALYMENNTDVKAVDLLTGKVIYTIADHSNYPGSNFTLSSFYPFTADGNLFIRQKGKQIQVLESISNQLIGSANLNTDSIGERDVSADGRYFLYTSYLGNNKKKFSIVDLKTREIISSFDLVSNVFDYCILSPDGAVLLVFSTMGNAELWDAKTGKKISRLQTAKYLPFNTAFLFTRDGKQLFVPDGNEYRLQDVRSGKLIRSFPVSPNQVKRIDLSSDSSMVGFVLINKVEIYKFEDSQKIFTSSEPQTNSSSYSGLDYLRFSPDGRFLLLGSYTSGIKSTIIELFTGNVIKEIPGYIAGIQNVVFTKDGNNLVFSYIDGNRSVWDISAITNPARNVYVDEQAVFCGKTITVPVEIDDAAKVAGAFLKIKYDPKILAFQSVKRGSLIPNTSPVVNSTEGNVTIALSQETALCGNGSLVELEFIPAVSALPGTTTSIQLEEAQLNDGAITAITRNGTLTFFEKRYRWGDLNGDDSDGTLDSSFIMQWLVGLIDVFPAETSIKKPQFPVYGDLNGDGRLGTVDSSLILQKKTGLINTYPVDTGKPINYGPEVKEELFSKFVKPENENLKRIVSLAETSMPDRDGMIDLSLLVDNADGVLGFYSQIQYDPALFEFKAIEKGDVTGNWGNPVVNNTNGTLKIAASGVQAINGEGTLAVLHLKTLPAYLNARINSEEIQIIQVELNDGAIPAESQNGKIVKSTDVMAWSLF